jgi:hypothetical protein
MMAERTLVMCNLDAVAGALGTFPQRHQLLNTIKRMRVAQSCITDLKLAKDTCDALSHLQGVELEMPGMLRTAAEHALIANAIVLYGRATSTTSTKGERGAVSIRDRLSPSQQQDHDALVTLRNRVIAHVYADEEVADSVWHQEKAVAATDDGIVWTVSCVTRRKQTDDLTLRRLASIIPVALALLQQTFHRRVFEIVELMHAAHVTDAQFFQHRVDPASIFGSYEEALQSWNGRHQGQQSGLIYDARKDN